jgi:hypothetical protein
VALKMARTGYGGGDPEKVLSMPVGIVVAMLHYEQFRDEYERAFMELNRKEADS